MKIWFFIPWVLPILLTGQFSPGKLSRFHAALEGNRNCVLCHELGEKEISDGCLQCHQPLAERIKANLGYHKDKDGDCGSCHSDHNGREFELIYWPKNIREFNHAETGYTLTGKHGQLDCADCHLRKNVTWEPIIQWIRENSADSALDRTFLGLSSVCNACHENIHENQVSKDCKTCHNASDWKNAVNEFDHNRARFLLTGAHINVDCKKCHPARKDRSGQVWQLTGLTFDNCSPCHMDVHKGSYGEACESCHTSADWKKDLKQFDHAKTKYPLEDKHELVKCAQCHLTTLAGGLPNYASCLSCHDDRHFRQFTARPDAGDCAACHTIRGFKPTTFTAAMHQNNRFLLDGSHLAVACSQCHQPFEPVPGKETVRFTWIDPACNVCHDDIHRAQFNSRYLNRCNDCHVTWIFKSVKFNHDKSNFPLDGKHENVKCNKCHRQESDLRGDFVRYQPVPFRCEDCHTFTDQIR